MPQDTISQERDPQLQNSHDDLNVFETMEQNLDSSKFLEEWSLSHDRKLEDYRSEFYARDDSEIYEGMLERARSNLFIMVQKVTEEAEESLLDHAVVVVWKKNNEYIQNSVSKAIEVREMLEGFESEEDKKVYEISQYEKYADEIRTKINPKPKDTIETAGQVNQESESDTQNPDDSGKTEAQRLSVQAWAQRIAEGDEDNGSDAENEDELQDEHDINWDGSHEEIDEESNRVDEDADHNDSEKVTLRERFGNLRPVKAFKDARAARADKVKAQKELDAKSTKDTDYEKTKSVSEAKDQEHKAKRSRAIGASAISGLKNLGTSARVKLDIAKTRGLNSIIERNEKRKSANSEGAKVLTRRKYIELLLSDDEQALKLHDLRNQREEMEKTLIFGDNSEQYEKINQEIKGIELSLAEQHGEVETNEKKILSRSRYIELVQNGTIPRGAADQITLLHGRLDKMEAEGIHQSHPDKYAHVAHELKRIEQHITEKYGDVEKEKRLSRKGKVAIVAGVLATAGIGIAYYYTGKNGFMMPGTKWSPENGNLLGGDMPSSGHGGANPGFDAAPTPNGSGSSASEMGTTSQEVWDSLSKWQQDAFTAGERAVAEKHNRGTPEYYELLDNTLELASLRAEHINGGSTPPQYLDRAVQFDDNWRHFVESTSK